MELKLNVNGTTTSGTALPMNGHNYATIGSVELGSKYDNGMGGSVTSNAKNAFLGRVDEVRIYQAALSDAALATLGDVEPESRPSDLVTYWDFEGNTNDTAVGGGKVDNGTLLGGASIAAGGVGNSSLLLTNDGDTMTTTTSPDINQAFVRKTVSLWFKPQNANSSDRQIIYHQGANKRGINIYLEDGQIYAGGWNDTKGWSGTWISSANVLDNQWNHVALVYNRPAGQLKLYVNGDLAGTGAALPLTEHSLGALGRAPHVTRYADGNGGYVNSPAPNQFYGSIDEVQIYDKALAAAEIQSLASLNP